MWLNEVQIFEGLHHQLVGAFVCRSKRRAKAVVHKTKRMHRSLCRNWVAFNEAVFEQWHQLEVQVASLDEVAVANRVHQFHHQLRCDVRGYADNAMCTRGNERKRFVVVAAEHGESGRRISDDVGNLLVVRRSLLDGNDVFDFGKSQGGFGGEVNACTSRHII